MRRVAALAIAGFAALALQGAPAKARSACSAPLAVCDVRDAVFPIKSFDPFGSAVRIGADLLVTNRHVVADEKTVSVVTPDGPIEATVVPTKFRGDLVLLKAKLPKGAAVSIRNTPLSAEDQLRTVGYDLARRDVQVYGEGSVLKSPAAGYALGRLHHTAHTQPGNSGGAVVDQDGQLVGIATSGGAGIFEAVPAKSIAMLKIVSGPQHASDSDALGTAYRECILATEASRRARGKLPIRLATPLEHACLASENRQLIALAGQAFGRTRDFETSERLFRKALELDPNAINSRLSLATTLLFARKPDAARSHVRQLLTDVPRNLNVHRMAIQIGKQTGDQALIATALDAIRLHNPKGLDAAQRFLKQPTRQRPSSTEQNKN